MKRRWASGTRVERYNYLGAAAFGLVVWVFMVAGELADRDELLWMNST